jgi:hypothetical protein
VLSQSDAVLQARAALEASAIAAGAALERYTTAVRQLQGAQLEEERQNQLLAQADLDVSAQKQLLGRWARQAYQGGGPIDESPEVVTLLQARSTDDIGTTLTWLRRVGRSKSRAVEAYELARQLQADLAVKAEDAATAAGTAAVAAGTAKQEKETAVQEQQAVVTHLENLLANTQDAAGLVADTTAALERAQAIAEARRRAAQATGDNRVVGQVGQCSGGDVSIYPNGQIPVSELCPLWGTSGHYLRADAAFAFDQLSTAYAQRFGGPVCVTDSYRTYESQVRLFAEKPNLAATPGRSNHGWGTAVDLCGGIQTFSTDQHRWMLANAPLFGWFHPAWAEPYGSRPEAWHWEYGG